MMISPLGHSRIINGSPNLQSINLSGSPREESRLVLDVRSVACLSYTTGSWGAGRDSNSHLLLRRETCRIPTTPPARGGIRGLPGRARTCMDLLRTEAAFRLAHGESARRVPPPRAPVIDRPSAAYKAAPHAGGRAVEVVVRHPGIEPGRSTSRMWRASGLPKCRGWYGRRDLHPQEHGPRPCASSGLRHAREYRVLRRGIEPLSPRCRRGVLPLDERSGVRAGGFAPPGTWS